ncbi:MAG TPA: hypothetical protein GXX46_07025 [Peptococcaceae bacterium]|nr:hypothetical protein [Peptococcaceae bacterium]
MSSERQFNLSNIFITITTLIFAITSLITVYISLSAWKEERESVRPYLTFHSSPEVYFDQNGQLVFAFRFTNVGLHPVANLHCQTIIANSNLTSNPLHTDQYSLVNNIPQNAVADLIIYIKKDNQRINEQNLDEHFIIINLKYTDPILTKDHEQIIYLRWAGIENAKINPIFHASTEEKKQIIDYLGQL